MILGLALLLAAAPGAETHLVAVGNDLGRPDEPELRYAESDAERLAEVLRELGRVAPENELVLRGVDASAFRSALLRTNAKLRRAASSEAAHALIVYYSGHADADGLHLGASTLSFEELKTIVESSPARVRVLIIDGCRSGGITRLKGVSPAEPFAIRLDDRLEVEGFAIITSSASSEDSQESDSLGASFFTHHLVNALRGAADDNGDARVTLQEAYAYAYRETLRSSGRTSVLQHPSYAYDLKGQGEFILSFLADGRGRLGTLSMTDAGTYLVYEERARGTLAAEVRASEGGTNLLLSPGRYFVQRRNRTSYREYSVVVTRDKTTQLDTAPYREITYAQLLRKGGGTKEVLHGLSAAAELRGALLAGFSVTPGIAIAYELDLEPLSLGAGLRFGRSEESSGLSAAANEFGLRLGADRYFDFEPFSLSVGILTEWALVQQTFDDSAEAPDRESFVFGFGASLGIERSFGPWVLRLRGGPIAYLLESATTDGGAIVGEEMRTELTYWLGLGVGFKL